MSAAPLLEVDDLRVEVGPAHERIRPVDGVSFSVSAGECLGLLGESGSGKTLTLKAVMGLLPGGGAVVGGRIRLAPATGDAAPVENPERIGGHGVAMVFQEPMLALNPTMRVGDLVAEGPLARGLPKHEARRRAVELMREVGIPAPEQRARAWPHQLSGGLRQRIMIAMALASEPHVLLCDEPTTAVDVTIQAQILGVLRRLREERGLAMVFVTHDLAVASQVTHRVGIMYAGRVIETGPVDEVFDDPRHPYTLGLLHAVRPPGGRRPALGTIGGSPPDPRAFAPGCRFAPRCPLARDDCKEAPYVLEPVGVGRASACIHPDACADAAREPVG
jgi:oligopeptide/dipeptide ABC transporter ATP-binding protein